MKTAIALAFMIMGIGAAFAAAPTEAEKRACRHDVARVCRHVMHESEQRVGQCLVLNAAHISKACQDVLRKHGQL
jgi:hypothetical protein